MQVKKTVNFILIIILSPFIITLGFLSYVNAASIQGNTTVYNVTDNGTVSSGALVNFDCNGTGKSAILVVVVDPYIGTNERELVKAYYLDASNNSPIQENITNLNFENRTRVVLDLNSTHSYNMTWVDADSAWEALVSSNESYDLTLLFKANSKSYQCINQSADTKFRIPYHYTFRFYQGSNYTSGDPITSYKNDFQYVYLRIYNKSASYTDSTIFRDMSYLDRIFKNLPWYQASFTKKDDNAVTFWGRYSDGAATIKLYEIPEDYSLYLMADDTYGLTWTNEFTKPQLQDYSWTSQVIQKITFGATADTTVNIYLSKFEVNKFLFLMNLGYWIVIIIIWMFIAFMMRDASWGAIIAFTLLYLTMAKLLGVVLF